jgi:hypothetical protein
MILANCLNLVLILNFVSNINCFILREKTYEKSPEESGLFEGDIAGTLIAKGASQIPTQFRIKWPGGVIPYTIDSTVQYCKF